jgi:hypothetical protein
MLTSTSTLTPEAVRQRLYRHRQRAGVAIVPVAVSDADVDALIEGWPIPEHRRRRGRYNGRGKAGPKVNSQPAKQLSQPEDFVFAVATFLIERGHQEAAADLAGNAQTAIAYLERANS